VLIYESTDFIRLQLLLRCRHGLPKTQYARILLGVLQSRSSTCDAQDALGNDSIRSRVLPDHSIRRYLFLRQECLRAVVARGGRMLGFLRPRTVHLELYAKSGMLPCRILNPAGSACARSFEVVDGRNAHICVGCVDNYVGNRAICLSQGWNRAGESCL
jgi:hypothetical protein